MQQTTDPDSKESEKDEFAKFDLYMKRTSDPPQHYSQTKVTYLRHYSQSFISSIKLELVHWKWEYDNAT